MVFMSLLKISFFFNLVSTLCPESLKDREKTFLIIIIDAACPQFLCANS